MSALTATLPRLGSLGLARSAPSVVGGVARRGMSLSGSIERALMLTVGSAHWLIPHLAKRNSLGAQVLRTMLDIHATAPLRLHTLGEGPDPQLTYADGTPAIANTRTAAMAYPVDAGTDTWFQSYLKQITAYLRGDKLVTELGRLGGEAIRGLPAIVGVPLVGFVNGVSDHVRELPGISAGIAGLARGVEVLLCRYPELAGQPLGQIETRLAEILRGRVAGPNSGLGARLAQLVGDACEQMAHDPHVFRGVYDAKNKIPGLVRELREKQERGEDCATEAQKVIALAAHPAFAFVGNLMGDEAGRFLRGAGQMLIALTHRHETSTQALRFGGQIRRGLRVAQAATWALYPRLIRWAEAYVGALPEDQRGFAKGVINVVSALFTTDRGNYKPGDLGKRQHRGMGPVWRPFVRTQQELWGFDELELRALEAKDPATLTQEEQEKLASADPYKRAIMRSDVHPQPEGLFGDFMRMAKAFCMDKNSWGVLLRIVQGIEGSALPQGLKTKLVEALLVSIKGASGFKDPFDGKAFRKYNPDSVDGFELKHDETGRPFVEDRIGELHMTAAREPAVWLLTLEALWRHFRYGPEEASKIVAQNAPDHRPARPGENVTLSQDGEIPVTLMAALRKGIGTSPEHLIVWWRAAAGVLARFADNSGQASWARSLRALGHLPYHAQLARATIT